MSRKCLKALLLIAALTGVRNAHAQVFTNKEVGAGNRALADSLKNSKYPYALPIWGDKATQRGFSLPFSAGVSTQYFGQRSDLVIENLSVGFNGGPQYDLDGLIRFDKVKSSSNGVSLRPDVWLFPFLNVYAILGRSSASTEVHYGIWLPDTSGKEVQVLSSGTKVDFVANTFGFGLTPTLGVGGGWLALDMNFTWTDVPQLAEPASAFVFDPRAGKSFRLRNPDENINFWVGGFRLKINTGTTGSIPLGDALPLDELQGNLDQAEQRLAQLNAELEAWWSSVDQNNPVNKARYEASKAAIARAAALLENANRALSNAASSTVDYSLDKRPEDMWNFTVGTQYQLNKSWMFRVEVGFLRSRTHVIAGAQFRFPL